MSSKHCWQFTFSYIFSISYLQFFPAIVQFFFHNIIHTRLTTTYQRPGICTEKYESTHTHKKNKTKNMKFFLYILTFSYVYTFNVHLIVVVIIFMCEHYFFFLRCYIHSPLNTIFAVFLTDYKHTRKIWTFSYAWFEHYFYYFPLVHTHTHSI